MICILVTISFPIFALSTAVAKFPQKISMLSKVHICFGSGVSMPEKRIFSPFNSIVSPSIILKLLALTSALKDNKIINEINNKIFLILFNKIHKNRPLHL